MGGPGFNPQYHKEKTKGLVVFLQHGVRATSHMLAGKATEAGSGASSFKGACAVRGDSGLFNPQHPVTSDEYIFP